jgi:hypothetical protein
LDKDQVITSLREAVMAIDKQQVDITAAAQNQYNSGLIAAGMAVLQLKLTRPCRVGTLLPTLPLPVPLDARAGGTWPQQLSSAFLSSSRRLVVRPSTSPIAQPASAGVSCISEL